MTATKTSRKTTGECLRCCGTGRLPTFGHVEAGRCFECGGKGTRTYAAKQAAKAAPAPVTSATEYYRDGSGWTVCLRYGAVNNKHVIFSHDQSDELSYRVFDTIEEARSAWRTARAELVAGGFQAYDPF